MQRKPLTLTYYLWRDKKDHRITFVTDYKEYNKAGQVHIDRYGYLDLELVASGPNKYKLVADYTQQQ